MEKGNIFMSVSGRRPRVSVSLAAEKHVYVGRILTENWLSTFVQNPEVGLEASSLLAHVAIPEGEEVARIMQTLLHSVDILARKFGERYQFVISESTCTIVASSTDSRMAFKWN
jgi:hypothetical protein